MNITINKFLVALAAAIATLAVVIQDGLTAPEILVLVFEFGGALGVYAVPYTIERR